MKHGTGDVKKIARLRRASLQADSPSPSQASASAVAASAMANAVAEVDEDGTAGAVSVTFREHGTLGLKFTPNKQTGNIELLAINPGTQAERHPALRPGLILQTVGGQKSGAYGTTLQMIKGSGRPLTLTFVPGGTVSSASSPVGGIQPRSRQAQPQQGDATAGLTGQAAQEALQEHVMKHGTGDVKKIARLRRASLTR